jgi:outer membrane protein
MVSRTLLTGLLLTAGAFAQMTSFPKPSYFRETFRKPTTKVELKAPARINDFVVTGPECGETPAGQPPLKCLRLSLQNYLELVMANNTQIQTDFLSVETAKNNVTGAYGAWDPSATFSLSPAWTRNSATSGDSNSLPINLGFSQRLSTGQSVSVSGGGTRSDTSIGNPSVSSNMSFSVTQPLIKNRGSYITRISLMQARSNLKISQFQLQNTLLTRINSAEGAYWNVVSARESLNVAIRARNIARENRDFVQKQLSLGAVAEIDTYASQTSVASREAALSNARFAVRVAEEAFRQQIAADLDSSSRDLPVSLTDAPDLSASERVLPDREQTVAGALARHPSLQTAMQRLDSDDLSLASARNGLLPQLDAQFRYSGSGSGQYTRSILGSQKSTLRAADGSVIALPGSIDPGLSAYLMALTPSTSLYGPYIPGGLGDAMSQLFRFNTPTYTASLTLTLPIRSRSASVTMANALITKKSDTLAVRSQQQSIRLNVSQALTNFEGAQENLRLAEVQLEYAQKDNAAMQQKYELGMVQQIEVLRGNQSLADAESAVVTAKVTLRNRLLALYLATGELLERRNIVIQP